MGNPLKKVERVVKNSKKIEETGVPCNSCNGTGQKIRKYGKRQNTIDLARSLIRKKGLMESKELTELIMELCKKDGSPVTQGNARQLAHVVRKHDDIRILDGLIYWIGDE